MRNILLLIVAFFSSTNAIGSIIRTDLTAFRNILDASIDGTPETTLFEQGLVPYSTYTKLDFDAGVLSKETQPLYPPAYVKVPFAEFDISSLEGSIVSASLNFTRFFANSWERLGQIQVSAYAADGVVTLEDYGVTAQTLGLSGLVPTMGTSQNVSIDVTNFLLAQTGDFVGFRFDMTTRGGARLLDDSYRIRSGQESSDWLKTPAPYLLIETAPAAVPLPGVLPLMLSGFAALGFFVQRRKV